MAVPYVTSPVSPVVIIIIYPLTARVVGAPPIISQPVSSFFPYSPLPSGTWRTPGLCIPWCCLPISSSICLAFFHCVQTQKLKSHLVRTQSLNILPLKPGVGQDIAIHATLSARDFFLAYFYPSGPFTCIFSKPLLISPVLAVANSWFLCRPAE